VRATKSCIYQCPSSAGNTTGAETHLERKWRPVNQRTELATGEILTGTILSIWLVQPSDKPESVVVMWPQRPTAVSPRRYAELAASVPPGCQRQHRVGGDQSGQAVMIINTSRVIQHNHESAITKIKSPTARRRRAL
jgi:hypothetical protein